jgi:hypothetical protein
MHYVSGQQTSGPLSASPPGVAVLVWRATRWRATPQSACLGNRLRPAADTEFTGKLKPTCVVKALTLDIVLSPECDYAR